MDVLPLENKETIHVEILEENLKSVEVYLDVKKWIVKVKNLI